MAEPAIGAPFRIVAAMTLYSVVLLGCYTGII
jgi:hypothetical protein